MVPSHPVIIMTLSYSHDIATALLAASGAALWMLGRHYPEAPASGEERFFTGAFRGISRLAKCALLWILIAGVPRILVYKQYEWADSAGDLQVVAIVIKHVVMFLLVGTGIYYWAKMGRKVKELKFKSVF